MGDNLSVDFPEDILDIEKIKLKGFSKDIPITEELTGTITIKTNTENSFDVPASVNITFTKKF